MRHKGSRTTYYTFLVVACLMLTSCFAGPYVNLPDTDIVYQTMAGIAAGGYSFGFVNADGSGLTTIRLDRGEGAAILPAWSGDGKTLIFRGEEHMPDVLYPGRLFVLKEGQGLKRCSPETTHGGGPLFISPDGKQAVASVVHELPNKLALVDLNDCKIANVYAVNEVYGGAISSSQLRVAFWQEGKIKVYEPTSSVSRSVIVVGPGIAPRWSPDDEWIAYTAQDGIYIVRPDGRGYIAPPKRIVAYNAFRPMPGRSGPDYMDWPPIPSWSPDGKWLVYHKCMLPNDQICLQSEIDQYSIFKVNIETGMEVKLLDGGLNPYWRWK